MKSTLIDISTAASLLKITPQQVRNLCRNKKLPSEKIGGRWLLYVHDIQSYYDKSCCGTAENQEITPNQKRTKPLALSFFSGAMGMDIGLEKAGFEILLSCEVNNACRKTILKNKPQIALIDDITNYDAQSIREKSKISPHDDIDLVVGGPPTAFS